MTAYIWALLTPAAMGAARRWRPRRGARLGNGLALAAAGIAAALLHLLATNLFWAVADRRRAGPDFVATFLATLSFGGAARLATFAGIVGVTWGSTTSTPTRRRSSRPRSSSASSPPLSSKA